MGYPVKRDKTITPSVISGIDVPSQGHVPGPVIQDVPMNNGLGPTAPKGEQKAKGFGQMLRSQMYKVR